MDSLLESIDPQVVLVIGTIAVSFLLLKLMLRVLNAGLGLIVAIVAIVLVLQYVFGIAPQQLWFEISHLPQDALQLVKNLG